ncbi:hypothetical protein FB451DRAFT_1187682 [Mycena latifolia]|nr:hypothetical protein FB451DRAFT_1187682 [Mycena latifolia]
MQFPEQWFIRSGFPHLYELRGCSIQVTQTSGFVLHNKKYLRPPLKGTTLFPVGGLSRSTPTSMQSNHRITDPRSSAGTKPGPRSSAASPECVISLAWDACARGFPFQEPALHELVDVVWVWGVWGPGKCKSRIKVQGGDRRTQAGACVCYRYHYHCSPSAQQVIGRTTVSVASGTNAVVILWRIGNSRSLRGIIYGGCQEDESTTGLMRFSKKMSSHPMSGRIFLSN